MEVIKRLKKRYWEVLRQVWTICSKPDSSLQPESLLTGPCGKDVLRNYVIPMAEMLSAVALVTTLLYEEGWQTASAVVKGLFTGLSYVASYGAIYLLARIITQRWFNPEADSIKIQQTIGALLSLNFAIKLIQLLMPNMFFVRLFFLYMFYLVWVTTGGMLNIAEEKRNKYMVVMTILLVIIPSVIMKILMIMVPNLLK